MRPRASIAPGAAETFNDDEGSPPPRASQAPRLVARAEARTSARPQPEPRAAVAAVVSEPPHAEGELAQLEHAAEDDVARLTRSFFSQPPAESAADVWDGAAAVHTMTQGTRRAMYAALSIFGGSMVLLIGYLVYTRLLMPVPAQLGTSSGMPAVTITHTAEPAAAAAPPQHVAPAAPLQVPAPASAVAAAQPAAPPAEAPAPTPAEVPVQPVDPAAAAPAPSAPAAAPAADDPQVEALLQAAHAFYDRKQRKQAHEAYEQVLAVQPNQPEALSKLGYLELQAGDDKLAKQYAERAVAVDPTSSEGWIVLGAALESLRDRAGARAAYVKCAELGSGPYANECKRLAR